ncbi:MAG: PqqD family protein [Endomicrobiales bacterium]|nr:PqqD family protein [Endomicrobiales bacterium]
MQRLNRDVLWKLHGGEMLVVNTVTDECFVLNDAAVEIVKLIVDGAKKDDILEALRGMYEAEIDDIANDYESIIKDLKESAILIEG